MTATLLDRLAALAAYGDRPAIRRFGADGGSTVVTYAELDAWARRLAAGLRAQGAGDGAYVGIYAPNSPDWLAARLAILLAGGVGVSLDTDLTPDALAQQLTASGARMVLTVRANQDALVQAGLGELDVRLLDAETNDLRALSQLEADPITALPAPDPDGVASLFFTSGTTGPPKGVPLTHRNLGSNVEALDTILEAIGKAEPLQLGGELNHPLASRERFGLDDGGGHVEVVGHPEVWPGDAIELPDARDQPLGLDRFLVKKVIHRLNSKNGFMTRIECGGVTNAADTVFVSDVDELKDSQEYDSDIGFDTPEFGEDAL